ncbi:MAG: SDR family NAD(P)-dependent oxidoreductase [Anaerolineae bacterium]
MKDKVTLVTGANSGLGKATAAAFAAMGAHVVMLCRSRTKAGAARAEIEAETGSDRLDLLIGDLAVQADIRRVAAEFRHQHERLDVLGNNAGISVNERMVTPDGIERTLAVNHLAPFLLTHLLLDRITGRFVNVTTGNFRQMDLDDLQWETRPYKAIPAYLQSKLGTLFFTLELAERLRDSGVTVNAVHPGVFQSNLGKSDGQPGLVDRLAAWSAQFLFPTADVAAQRVIYVATAPELEGISGGYWAGPKRLEPPAQALDQQARQRLWTLSARLTGLTADIPQP